jgi:hypothetical protein
VLSPVVVKGKLFAVRPVQLECTVSTLLRIVGRLLKLLYSKLAIAKPLSYTRGTVIPLVYTVKCSADDRQALDLLCVTSAIPVRLDRINIISKDSKVKSSHTHFTGHVSTDAA